MKILTHRQYCELRDEAAKVPSLEAKINPGYSGYNKMSINQLRIIITDAVNEIKKRTKEMERHTRDFRQNNSYDYYKL